MKEDLNKVIIISLYEEWEDILQHADYLHIGTNQDITKHFIKLSECTAYWRRFILESLIMNDADLNYVAVIKNSPVAESGASLILEIGFDPEYLQGIRDNQDVDWYL